MEFRVYLAGPGMDFPGLGRATTGWGSGIIEAEDEEEAIEIAREKCRESFDADYARGRATVSPVYSWRVVLRGRKDKRRRETFFVKGADRGDAVRMLRTNAAAVRFAGYDLFLPEQRPRRECPIVRIERLA